MSALLWRVLIAVFAVVIVNLLLPPLMRVLGFPLDGDVLLIVRVCILGLAVFYILRGKPVGP